VYNGDVWYMIPGFNGYEINEDKVVRSMKRFNAVPGYLIKLYKGGYYELSDNHCKRVRKTPDELWDLVQEQIKNSKAQVRVREDYHNHISSRNKFKNFYPESIEEDKSSPGLKRGSDDRFYMDFSGLMN